MQVPTQDYWSNGETMTETKLNTVANLVIQAPRILVRQGSTTTLSNGSWGTLGFTIEDMKVDMTHSTTSNTERLIAATAGTYLLSGVVTYASSAGGARRGARWRRNGSGGIGPEILVPSPSAANNGVPAVAAPTLMVYLAVGDWVELHGYQDSGGNLSTLAGTYAQAVWIGS